MSLTQADYTKAIDAIVERREALIMSWADNPSTFLPSVHAGLLERIKGDLRELRRLQAGLAEESDKGDFWVGPPGSMITFPYTSPTGKVYREPADLPVRMRTVYTPDWLMREHPSD